MGASLDLVLEYDDSDRAPFSSDIDGVVDFTKSFNIVHGKPYALMQALAGIRGDTAIKPKIPARGLPKNMNHQVAKYFRENHGLDNQYSGWLSYSELLASAESASLRLKDLEEPIQLVFGIFKMLVEKYGDSRVRLVFAIST
jgi:hypothetical protein